LNYQKEIDGLRAVAVISIILFHLDVSGFSGGFVGVDVFFVISGYLITRLIRVEVSETQGFSYSRFYLRRARRLFPSLFFTLCLSFIFAFLLFAPQDFQRFGGALIGSASGFSNFYFWSESGYFDVSADTKPLLHIWSLSLEEQFYILWPLLIVFLLTKISKHKQRLGLLIIGISSLLLNFVLTEGRIEIFALFPSKVAHWFADGPATIFYLMPFRVFEFAIGAILVWLIHLRPKNKQITEIFVLIGLSMIVYPVTQFTKDTLFPSYNALLPCFGAALIIHSGATQYTSRLLNNQIAVGIGLISYSLYLIHWPIIVFYKYLTFSELILTEQLTLFSCSIVAATLMYKFIEQPFRQKVSSPTAWSGLRFSCACVILSLLIILPSSNVWWNNAGPGEKVTSGWPWRSGVAEEYKAAACYFFYKDDHLHMCEFKTTSEYDFIIIGDSFGYHLYPGFQRLSKEFSKSFATFRTDKHCNIFEQREYLSSYNCANRLSAIKDFIASNKIKRVIISYNWISVLNFKKHADIGGATDKPQFIADSIKKFFDDKQFVGIKDIMLILNIPKYLKGLSPRKCNTPTYIIQNRDVGCISDKIEEYGMRRKMSSGIKKAKFSTSITFLDPFEAFCDETHCYHEIEDRGISKFVYVNGDHLTSDSSIYFAEYFKSQIFEFLNF
jgi:peptidoglycan/LPS O-acetylase OafA/YrhL